LERDENIKLTLPGGRVANASLAGRDPTTDVAVLRFQPDGLPVATTAEARLRAGQVVVAVGNHEGAPLAALGIVALAGGAWHSLRGHGGSVLSAAFSPDGSRIVTASDDKTARIWDATTAKEIAVLRGHDDALLSAAFSPDGSRIVTASDDKTARIWDAASGKFRIGR
jgi:WD40 repeat protein